MKISQKCIITILLCSIIFTTNSSSTTSKSSLNLTQFNIKSLCRTTPYPETCFSSLKLSISITINPNIVSYLLQTLQAAITESEKLSSLLSNLGNGNIVESRKGSVQDCVDLHQITLFSLRKSFPILKSPDTRKKVSDAKTFLSAALTNKNTCLESLDSASGPLKSTLVDSISDTYKHVSNSLSMLTKKFPGQRRRLLDRRRRRYRKFDEPKWVYRKHGRRLDSDDEYDPSEILTVAGDGSGNFTTVMDAINFAPNNSYDRVIIYIKSGVYNENVEISSNKTNIVLLGYGRDVTVITGSRSVVDGWTTFRSATVAVSGEGFLARDITFENTAGPAKHQAVALRVSADLAALYRCTINGYQDTLYVHSFRQFYRECDISGTVDFIFGNAAVVFQGCNIISRMPLPGQFTVITAQSRDTPDENTGISIQNCSVLATDDLYSNSGSVKSFLGRPWRAYSTTVYLESFIDDFLDPRGWAPWNAANEGLDTLYYGEYKNNGPGSETDTRVSWPGHHVMSYSDASNFTVSELLMGNEWLDSTSFPYDEGI